MPKLFRPATPLLTMAKRGTKRDGAEEDRFHGSLTAEVMEFVRACDDYRRANDVRYLAYSDYFAVLHDDLGYRKTTVRAPAVVHVQRTVNAFWRAVWVCGERSMVIRSAPRREPVATVAFKCADMLRCLGVPVTIQDDGAEQQSRLFWGDSPCVPVSLPLTLRADRHETPRLCVAAKGRRKVRLR